WGGLRKAAGREYKGGWQSARGQRRESGNAAYYAAQLTWRWPSLAGLRRLPTQ
ncbi:hypothetical protein E2320_009390, partial [Naja naja]